VRAALAALAAVLALAACGTGSGHSTPSAGHASSAPAPAVLSSAAGIARQLQGAGLPVTSLITYTAASDPNQLLGRQGAYTSKASWADPRAARQDSGDTRGSVGLGGSIEVYPAAAGAWARYAYLRGFQPPLGDGYDYLSGAAVLRLSQYLTPAQAHPYETAFAAAAGRR
jgi:hypothetical protein